AELEEDTDRDDEAVAVLRGGLEVRLPVRRRLGDVDAALDLQLLDRPLQAHVGQMVEALVVEAADVGDESDLDRGIALCGRGTTDSCDGGNRYRQDADDRCDRKRHPSLSFHFVP